MAIGDHFHITVHVWSREGEEEIRARIMGYLRDILLYLEPALLPELATYETEVFAGTILVTILTFVREYLD